MNELKIFGERDHSQSHWSQAARAKSVNELNGRPRSAN